MSKLQDKIDKLYSECKSEPKYAEVEIEWQDNHETCSVLIKLSDSSDSKWEDEQIFFYCTGLNDLKSLCEKGPGTEFVITDIYGFFDNL